MGFLFDEIRDRFKRYILNRSAQELREEGEPVQIETKKMKKNKTSLKETRFTICCLPSCP